jgi:hypothetical protein
LCDSATIADPLQNLLVIGIPFEHRFDAPLISKSSNRVNVDQPRDAMINQATVLWGRFILFVVANAGAANQWSYRV